MKVVVTGGAGFIASHIVDALVKEGHEVVVIDNLTSGSKKNINSQAKHVNIDITSPELKHILDLEKPDYINHHAAHIKVGDSVNNPLHDAKINITGTINLLEAVKSSPVKHITFASSGGAMYGSRKPPYSEALIPQPLSPYGVSKRAAELYLHYYYEQYGIPYTILRYANVYGPRQNFEGEAGVVSIFINQLLKNNVPTIYGSGTQTRDFVFVEDVVDANVKAMKKKILGEYNIGTGLETTVEDLYWSIAEKLDIQEKPLYGKAREGEQLRSSLQVEKARNEMDWKPNISLHEGISKTIDYFSAE